MTGSAPVVLLDCGHYVMSSSTTGRIHDLCFRHGDENPWRNVVHLADLRPGVPLHRPVEGDFVDCRSQARDVHVALVQYVEALREALAAQVGVRTLVEMGIPIYDIRKVLEDTSPAAVGVGIVDRADRLILLYGLCHKCLIYKCDECSDTRCRCVGRGRWLGQEHPPRRDSES